MNLVIDDAVEVTLANAKKETPEERRNIGQSRTRNSVPLANSSLGQILLKGDNISLIQQLQ
jgi:small nuclear ribonucleoprotein E